RLQIRETRYSDVTGFLLFAGKQNAHTHPDLSRRLGERSDSRRIESIPFVMWLSIAVGTTTLPGSK
ncbi:hypothetical protein, partial [Pseudoalteromonas sp. S1612]|uniref:hypothetical protein n=1 Tax=Pseudoalteromonas sp. S1612 TaxID=579507 RepID=UPI001BB1DC09